MEAIIDKKTLRTKAKAAVNELSAQSVVASSASIAEHLFALPEYQSAKCIGLYAATYDEPQTGPIFLHATQSGKKVAFPRVRSTEEHSMDFHWISSGTELRPHFGGILAPQKDAPIAAASEIDLFVIPGLAFDKEGHRLGHGAGYYDRYLTQIQSTFIGLAFDCQVFPKVPAERWDQAIHFLITEQGVWSCTHSCAKEYS